MQFSPTYPSSCAQFNLTVICARIYVQRLLETSQFPDRMSTLSGQNWKTPSFISGLLRSKFTSNLGMRSSRKCKGSGELNTFIWVSLAWFGVNKRLERILSFVPFIDRFLEVSLLGVSTALV